MANRARYYHLSTEQLSRLSRELQEEAMLVQVTPQVRRAARSVGLSAEQLRSALLLFRLRKRRRALRWPWPVA